MYQNSKIEARCEAVRLATAIKDVTSENILEISKRIEDYIVGGIDLPEVYDPNTYIKELMEKVSESMNSNKENKTKGVDPNIIKVLGDA